MKRLALMFVCLVLCCVSSIYAVDLENLALIAKVEAEGSDIPVENVKDGNFTTRWNAKNDDVDTWIQFTWDKPQRINRVHVTEFRSRITAHTIEYGEKLEQVKNLKMEPKNPADALNNHPNNQQAPVVIPDHKLTFDTVTTIILRYHVTGTRGPTDEPSLWEIEIFFDPSLGSSLVQSKGKLAVTWGQLKIRE